MGFFDWLEDTLNGIYQWFKEGIYDFVVEAFAYFVEVSTVGMIKFAIMAVDFAWDVAKTILSDLGLTQALNAAWSTIPSDTAQGLMFFGIPDVVNILLAAFVTRWVLRFIPFLGK